MPEIADRERFCDFLHRPPTTTSVDRAELLGWLSERGDFDVGSAEASVDGEPHTLLVWGEEPDQSYRAYVIPTAQIDLALGELHNKVFGARVHRDLEPELFEPAVRLMLRASFQPDIYWGKLGDIRAGVTQKRSSLPRDAALEPEVARWHPYQITDGAGLNRNISELCTVRFMRWS